MIELSKDSLHTPKVDTPPAAELFGGILVLFTLLVIAAFGLYITAEAILTKVHLCF